jgi:hypothetical protein
MPTPGSVFWLKSVWPMPRMKNEAAALLPPTGAVSLTTRLGTTRSSPVTELTCLCSSALPEKAEIAIGVSCSDPCACAR